MLAFPSLYRGLEGLKFIVPFAFAFNVSRGKVFIPSAGLSHVHGHLLAFHLKDKPVLQDDTVAGELGLKS